jgi:hypothetical protein
LGVSLDHLHITGGRPKKEEAAVVVIFAFAAVHLTSAAESRPYRGLDGRAESPAPPKSLSLKAFLAALAFGKAIATYFNMTLRFVYIERKSRLLVAFGSSE